MVKPIGAKLLPEADLTITLCSSFRFWLGRVLKYDSLIQDLVAVSIKALHKVPWRFAGNVVPHLVPFTTCSTASTLCLSWQ